MAKEWIYKYNSDTILVKNSVHGSSLQINNALVDQKNGLSLQDNLKGVLPGGQEVSVSLGGTLSIKCSLFVDNVLQEPVEVK